MEQFLSVLKIGGLLLIVVPRKESNFDRKRDVVKFKHLLEDYKSKVKEDDLSHLAEVIKNHDSRLSPLIGSPKDFLKRGQENYQNRCLHQHVFDSKVMQQIFKHFNLELVKSINIFTDYVVIGRKG
jgi:hypothetical protein